MNEDAKLPALLRFQPRYASEVGAGSWLLESLDRPRLEREAVSESLEFGPELKVEEGPLAGALWSELVERFGEALLGARGVRLYEQGLGLEARFLAADASDGRTRVVKPLASRSGPPLPAPSLAALTVIESRPGAVIYYGRRPSLPPEHLVTLWRRSPAQETLADHLAVAGQTILCPGGLPHALGQGTLAYETRIVKTRSLRAEDRAESTGRERVRESIITAAAPSSRLYVKSLGYLEGRNAVTWLYATDFLTATRLELRAEASEPGPRDSFLTLTGIAGRALVIAGDETETIGRGRTLVLSAAAPDFRLNPGPEGAVILKTWLPDPVLDIERPLLNRGLSQREIEGLYGFFGRKVHG